MIGPGIQPIPSTGWGGVEALIWNCKLELEKLGHEVKIQNTWLGNNLEVDPDIISSTVNEINDWKPDFVHLHYDHYADIMPYINAPRAMTSHYPYIDYPDRRHGYEWIFHKFSKNHSSVFALSDRNAKHFELAGVSPELVFVWYGGVLSNNFRFVSDPKLFKNTICLGKIEPRKMQYELQRSCNDVHFVGPTADVRFNNSDPRYLGSWTRDEVYNQLTDYANMVLLSDGESAPQVVMEALVSGLGLVVSEEASANLDTSLPFIDVVNKDDINNLSDIISMNREKSLNHRDEIREYGISEFGMKNCSVKYINEIKRIIQC